MKRNRQLPTSKGICVPKELQREGLGLEPGQGPGERIEGRPWDGTGTGTGWQSQATSASDHKLHRTLIQGHNICSGIRHICIQGPTLPLTSPMALSKSLSLFEPSFLLSKIGVINACLVGLL